MLRKTIIISIFLWSSMQSIDSAISATPSKPLWNQTWNDILKRDLLMTYDKFSRPSEVYNVTTIDLGLTLRHIDIDEEKSVFTVFSWLKMEWNDDKLKWNQSNYGNLTDIHLANHEIWQPDILLFNSASGSDIDHYGSTYTILRSSGQVLWVPPATFQTFCAIDLRYWPFDSHQCNLILGSWTFDSNKIDLKVTKSDIGRDLLIENAQWEVMQLNAQRNVKYYSCCEEPYVDIQINITVTRRSPTYKAVVIVPATGIILMTLATFWLPAHYGEKILLNGVNLVVIVMFLIYFAQKLTALAASTPLIVLFYSKALYMVTFSTIISVIVINLTRNKHNRPIPWIIKRNLDGSLGQFLLINRISSPNQNTQRAQELRDPPFDEHVTSDDHHIIQSNTNKTPLQQDWIALATAIDRIAFILYTLIFVIFAIVYSL